jgi:hypothetical protein
MDYRKQMREITQTQPPIPPDVRERMDADRKKAENMARYLRLTHALVVSGMCINKRAALLGQAYDEGFRDGVQSAQNPSVLDWSTEPDPGEGIQEASEA